MSNLQRHLVKVKLRKLEEASVVFKETQSGSEYYEVLKTRDPKLTLGKQYSEDLVKYYVLMNEKIVVLKADEDLFEAPAETITHEGVEYKRVDREAREGDVVVFDRDYNPVWLIKGGKTYRVYLNVNGKAIFDGEDGDSYCVYHESNFVNRPPAVVKVYEPIVAKPAPLQVGDYAKVVGGGNFSVGDIVKILSDDGSKFSPLLCGLVKLGGEIAGECDGYLRHFKGFGELIRATDEEVAEAKRQQAKKAVADKWAEIGRKPNEFKVGDAVQYKKAFTTVSYVGPKYIRIRQSSNVENNIAVNPANLTLVFPVESKFGGDSE